MAPSPDQDFYLVTHQPLAIADLVDAVNSPALGGTAVFVGTVRSPNLGKDVAYLDYEGYETMIESEMRLLAHEARAAAPAPEGGAQEVGPIRIVIAHRLGRLEPGEAAVVVAVAARHRAQALRLCAELVDASKARLPIWKLEVGVDGSSEYAGGTAVAAQTLT